MVVRLLTLVVAALLVGGCSGKDEPAASGAISTGLDGASTTAVGGPAVITETALLIDVRAARHPGYDRVVFAFANGLPGYDVEFIERPVIADGSGDEVAVDGGAVLRVRMEPALDADLSKESAPATYAGPTRLSPDAAAVAELVRTGGFEGVLVWAIGLDRERPFRVTTVEVPPMLVIDIDAS